MAQEQTIGRALKQAREDKQLTLEEVSQALHIRSSYLLALENDQPEKIPTPTQARGFLRSYGSFLDLSPETLQTSSRPKPSKRLKNDSPESPEAKDESGLSYHLIFHEIGTTLQERRDLLGLSKEDIEAHTHIPGHYVDYIEAGNFHLFPSPAQARGMLSNYLSFLDVPAEEIMGQYADALQLRRTERQPASADGSPDPQSPPPPAFRIRMPNWVRMFITPDLILITSIGLIVIFMTIWGIGRVSQARANRTPVPTAPSLVEALLPTATLVPTSTSTLPAPADNQLVNPDPAQPEETAIPTVQIAGGSSIQAYIITRQRAYLRVTVDGIIAYDGRVIPGENITFSGQEEIRILTGNAAAMQVFFNDQDLGVLGIYGEVVEIFLTREGVIRPTAAPTPTVPPEQLATETAEPTPTSSLDLPQQQDTPVP